MKRVSYLVLVAFFEFFALVDRTIAQPIELKKIRLNVFRIDAATVASRLHGYFAGEGLDVDVTPTPNSTEQMRGVSQGKFEIVSTAFDNVLAWSGHQLVTMPRQSMTTATSCGDSRCFSLSHRSHIRTKSPSLPDSRIVPGVVTPAPVNSR